MTYGFNQLVSALEVRFDFQSARITAREALARAGLTEQSGYSDAELQRFADGLAAVARHLDKVWLKLGVSPSGQPLPVVAPVVKPAPVVEAPPEPEPVVQAAPEPEPVVEDAPGPEPEPEPVVEAAPEPEPVVEAAPEPEPVIEAAPEPEPVIEAERGWEDEGARW